MFRCFLAAEAVGKPSSKVTRAAPPHLWMLLGL